MKIGIQTNVDNRILIYTLARLYSLVGNVAIFTDNSMYKQIFLDDDKNIGMISGIGLCVIDSKDIEKTKEELLQEMPTLDYELYMFNKKCDKELELDLIVNCTNEKMVLNHIYNELKTDIPTVDFIITTNYKLKNDALIVNGSQLLQMFKNEEYKNIEIITDKNLTKYIVQKLDKYIPINIENLTKLLLKK